MSMQFKSPRSCSVVCTFLAASALYLLVPGAHAADPAPAEAKAASQEVKNFLALDTNHDGFVDEKEAGADNSLAKVFAAVDINKDGRLTLDEYAKSAAVM